MNPVIKDILVRTCSKEEKEKALSALEDEIRIVRGVLCGEYRYCEDCDDYYLAKSFLEETGTVQGKVCTNWDPISGNEYADGYIRTTYSICPKGHKRAIGTSEHTK